jgi:membrane protein DedA with SNARE-associated domain
MAVAHLTSLLNTYGYAAVAGIVALEGMGIPLPGETALTAAAVDAGTTHDLDIVLVIAAAAAGGMVGDNVGYWIGREAGYRLLLRYGGYVRLTEPRLKLGLYLFHRYGGAIVFFGRFFAMLRILAPLLAGANRMQWPRFAVFNAAGAISWATLYGTAAFLFGDVLHLVSRRAGLALLVAAVALVIAGVVYLRRNEERLLGEAGRAFPGPLTVPPMAGSQIDPRWPQEIVITILLPASSSARAPGGTRHVASYSSMMSGPRRADVSSKRRSTGVSTKPYSGPK